MVKSVVTRDELRRLQKAAREKDIKHLGDWATQFEKQICQEYEKEFQKQLSHAIDDLYIALGYTLKFSETTNFGPKRFKEFMDDLFATIDNFRTGAYNPEEYKQILKENGIEMLSNKEE